ncbi:MAG: hypothetical protein ACOX2M_02330 [Fastidiosipilaceae bacterium]
MDPDSLGFNRVADLKGMIRNEKRTENRLSRSTGQR